MNKLKYIIFCGFVGLTILSNNSMEAKTAGERLDNGIKKTKDAYDNAKNKVRDTYKDTKEKARDAYNEALENSKSK